jgi:hypothetical protein
MVAVSFAETVLAKPSEASSISCSSSEVERLFNNGWALRRKEFLIH